MFFVKTFIYGDSLHSKELLFRDCMISESSGTEQPTSRVPFPI